MMFLRVQQFPMLSHYMRNCLQFPSENCRNTISTYIRRTYEVKAERPPNLTVKHLKSNPLAIEQFLTDARIPEIIKRIEGQTIIYTEYVTDVIEKLSKALENAGYSYAEYTGSDHSGKERFLNKKVQVLIASRPISVG